MERDIRTWAVVLLVSLAALLSGCRRERAPEPRPIPPDAGQREPGEAQASTNGRLVVVALRDFAIQMPATLPAGPTTFHISNLGEVAHTIAIEGQGISQRLEQNLEPGQTGTLSVNLRPGSYRVWCPIGNHARRGMDMTLTVTPARE